jgi:hypothetical protein
MNYAEAAYFQGAHVAHIAAWPEHRHRMTLLRNAADLRRERRMTGSLGRT